MVSLALTTQKMAHTQFMKQFHQKAIHMLKDLLYRPLLLKMVKLKILRPTKSMAKKLKKTLIQMKPIQSTTKSMRLSLRRQERTSRPQQVLSLNLIEFGIAMMIAESFNLIEILYQILKPLMMVSQPFQQLNLADTNQQKHMPQKVINKSRLIIKKRVKQQLNLQQKEAAQTLKTSQLETSISKT